MARARTRSLTEIAVDDTVVEGRAGTCAGCRHWRQIAGTRGECLRHAPRPVLHGEIAMLSSPPARDTIWPATYAAASCGEYEGRP